MLTLSNHPDNIPICDIVRGKRVEQEVLWHPRRNEELQNKVEKISHFNTPYLRDMFELSKGQAESIFSHLEAGTTDVTNQKAFFRVKKHIHTALYTEMDLSDNDLEFSVRFEKDTSKYTGHELVISGTGSGKTYYCVQRILKNLTGPKARRRNFIVFSAEWHMDKTLAPLKKERFERYISGIDCGTEAFKESQHQTEDEFFTHEILAKVENAQGGSVILWDDAREIVAPDRVRKLIDRLLRVGRHQGVSIMVILHNLKSGSWSTQAYSSIKYLTVFCRSQKAKIVNFLNRDLGLPLGEARDHVYAFAQTGRTCMIRFHAPECLIGPKLLRLL